MSFNSLLNRTCTISRSTDTGVFDDNGDPTLTTADTENVLTRIDNETNRYMQDGKIINIQEYVAFFLPTVDVQMRDTLTVGSATYVVTNVEPIYAYKNLHHYECRIERVIDNG